MSSAYERKLPRGVETPLVLVIAALAMRALLLFQIRRGETLGFHRPSLAWSVAFLALTCPAGILIHEGGHYLAGIAAGLRFRRFVIGPLELARHTGRWRMRWIPLRQAGLVDFARGTLRHFRLRRAICVAGGPLTSLVSGLAFMALSLGAPKAAQYWTWSFCAQWCLVGLLGLVPFRRGAARSDGSLLWELVLGIE